MDNIGVTSSAPPLEKWAHKLVSITRPPEKIRLGTWYHFNTTCRECPAGCGMTVRHRDGRVVNCEGNPRLLSDIEVAVELMRKAGLAKADKKAGRVAAEGMIAAAAASARGDNRPRRASTIPTVPVSPFAERKGCLRAPTGKRPFPPLPAC